MQESFGDYEIYDVNMSIHMVSLEVSHLLQVQLLEYMRLITVDDMLQNFKLS